MACGIEDISDRCILASEHPDLIAYDRGKPLLPCKREGASSEGGRPRAKGGKMRDAFDHLFREERFERSMMAESEFAPSIPDALLEEGVGPVKEYQFLGEFALLDQYLLRQEGLSLLGMNLGIADSATVSVEIGKKLDQSRITTAGASKESDAISIVQEPQ